jgi:hypothetical protein
VGLNNRRSYRGRFIVPRSKRVMVTISFYPQSHEQREQHKYQHSLFHRSEDGWAHFQMARSKLAEVSEMPGSQRPAGAAIGSGP